MNIYNIFNLFLSAFCNCIILEQIEIDSEKIEPLWIWIRQSDDKLMEYFL